ncbi:TVP38/TMEM64 family protein [Stratiformator vulcanicus]|uniref:TVP38/TMEM64 family membrane protein n=1 Tax=Stratiformator vulcanicus TaxID=2527980 RepID=A0A517R4E4_9PLAN|nr:VTT domain-containing protein [Stratiformator vulcanicus]QDT38693.1 SNARE associated Golgi protein [Stratiformator vulcanicus]
MSYGSSRSDGGRQRSNPRGAAVRRAVKEKPPTLKVSSPTTLLIQAVILLLLYAGVALIYWNGQALLPTDRLPAHDAKITDLQQQMEAAAARERARLSPDAEAKARGEVTRINSEITQASEARAADLAELREREASYVAYGHADGFRLLCICFGLSLMAAAIGLPVRLTLVAAYGYLFHQVYDDSGVIYAVLCAAAGEAIGAMMQYWFVHWFLRDMVKRVNPSRVKAIDTIFGSEAAFVLFSLRLIPGMPYLITNLVIGLSPIRTITFTLVSVLGLLPIYLIYASAGADLTSLETLLLNGPGESVESVALWGSLAVVGMVPLVIRLLTNKEIRGGFSQLKELADDSGAPTIADARKDISELEDDAPGSRKSVRAGASGRRRRR